MTVLVTGATGLLGGHVTRLLLARGERPRVLVRPGDEPGPLARTGVDVRVGDLGDRGALRAAVDGVQRVVHCAARTGPWGPEEQYEATNVRGLQALVEEAQAAGVRRIVHVSSITVHGNDVHGTVDETAPLRGAPNPYSRSKVAGERLLERLVRDAGAPVTVVRPGWIYGPGDRASFGRFAALIEQRRMILVGSGSNHVPLVYVADAAEGVLLAAEAEHAVGRSYLLVNDEPVTQHDFVAAIAAGLGVPEPTRRVPYRVGLALGAAAETAARVARRREPPPVMRYGLQLLGGENRFLIGRARRELGFAPRVGLAEGISRSIAWYREAGGPEAAAGGRA
jgi:nucleoside-diphosphate-sugar epimerase